MPKELPKIVIDNRDDPDGSERVVEFLKPWATATSNTKGGGYPKNTRTRYKMPGKYVEPPIVTPPPVEPVPVPPTGMEPSWAITIRNALRAAPLSYVPRTTPAGNLTVRQLNDFIRAQSNGSRIIVPPGSTVDLTGTDGINFAGRDHLELVIDGVNVLLNTDGTSNLGSGFFMQGSHWIKVKGGDIRGTNPNTGTSRGSETADEQKSGASIRYDSDHIEFDNVKFHDIDGFGVFISVDGGINASPPKWPTAVWFHGHAISGGVMAFGVVAARDLIIEDGDITDTNWFPYDFEPDNSSEGYERVLIQRDTIDRFGWEAYQGNHTHWLLAMNPASSALGATMRDLTFRDNHVIRGHVPGAGANRGGGGLLMRFDKANIKDGLTITGNRSDEARTAGGAPVQGNAVRNANITGNIQPRAAGAPFYVHTADAVDVPDVNVVSSPNP